jgi:hypothetical protein
MTFEKYEKVKIIACDSQPRFIGMIGEIIKERKNFVWVDLGLEIGKRWFYLWEVEKS